MENDRLIYKEDFWLEKFHSLNTALTRTAEPILSMYYGKSTETIKSTGYETFCMLNNFPLPFPRD